jgi:alpha-tubulin suppressor-like RCC1 family protein
VRGERHFFDRISSNFDSIVIRFVRITSIAAGRDHLLALTSSGRTFVHPITKNANSHGQLGFRKFDIPDPSSISSGLDRAASR